jgi:hypothetical protein
MKPCSCIADCRGAEGLAAGFVCTVDNPGIHERLMQLPEGKTCANCAHLQRCLALGCTRAERTACDFYPNMFRERALA